MKRFENSDNQVEPRDLFELAGELGLPQEMLVPQGRLVAKVRLDAIDALQDRPLGKQVLVTSLNPTPFGEGKTVTTIGLGMGLGALDYRSICTLREPSMGPLFGVKGGGAGGGSSFLVPRERINLHFTSDFYAVAMAHNLLAAAIDQTLFRQARPGFSAEGVTWRRVLDLNDRALRHVMVRPDGRKSGEIRPTGFDITAASELMAILALSRNFEDMRSRLGRIVVGRDDGGKPVNAEELGVAGAMAVLMRDSLLPNFVQTCGGTPALVHTGPFANIAHGCSSVVADMLGLRLADFVVTEAGFGADMGAEKFFHIKCRAGGFNPAVAVLVATVRALKYHSGAFAMKPGQPLPAGLLQEDMRALEKGEPNLEKQIQNAASFGVPVIVAINRFPADTDAEVECLREMALSAGAEAAVESTPFQRGAEGARELARVVADVARESRDEEPRYLFSSGTTVREKVETIARQLYGAAGVEWSEDARRELAWLDDHGFGKLPVCMAKTQYSLSHDPTLLGAPKGFTLPVKELRLSAGAGFVTVLCGKILLMPGFSANPAYHQVELDGDGTIRGL